MVDHLLQPILYKFYCRHSSVEERLVANDAYKNLLLTNLLSLTTLFIASNSLGIDCLSKHINFI